jgi:hypothetical protein
MDIFSLPLFFLSHPPIFVRLLENPVSYYVNEEVSSKVG